jgi:uncharacterized repeat protein (TIGR01451 family)
VVDVDGSTRGTISNTASVRGNETDPIPENNQAAEPTTIITEVDLAITKSDSVDPAVAGQPLVYQLTVTNSGPSDATGVTVTDVLPAGVSYSTATASQGSVSHASGTVTALLGDLAQGATAIVDITVDVDPATRGTIHNTATVDANETETNPSNNEATEPTQIIPRIDLAVTKTDSIDPAAPGGPLTYRVVVTNNGPSDATGVTVIDTLPDAVSYSSGTETQSTISHSGQTVNAEIGDLASGASATVTIVVGVAPTARGVIMNSATVSGNETETSLANNMATEPTEIDPQVDLVIFKTDSPDPVNAGQQLTYTLSVLNNGPSDATNVNVTDTLPAGVAYRSASTSQGTFTESGGTVTASLGSLAAGANATVTIVVDVDPSTRGEILNQAEVRADETETNPDNNVDNEPTVVGAQIDLAVTKADVEDPVTAGDQLTYRMTVTNNGPSQATGVTLVDSLPEEVTYLSAQTSQGTISASGGVVTADIGALGVGQTVTATIVTKVDVTVEGTITNRAEVSGNETEIVKSNNVAMEPTTVDAVMSSLGGYVYFDADDDGIKDAGEIPIAGVVIRLTGTDFKGNSVAQQMQTLADGSYLFEGLAPGVYSLVEEHPKGYRDGRETAGTLTGSADFHVLSADLASTPLSVLDDAFAGIALDAGVDGRDFLFAERPRAFSKRMFLSSS